MIPEFPLLILVTILFISGLALTAWIHNHYHLDVVVSPALPPPGRDLPLISVIVPARNEERNIRAYLTALLAQTYSRLEVIVVDDRSTDRTLQILADLQSSLTRVNTSATASRLLDIQRAVLPPGWAGTGCSRRPRRMAVLCRRRHFCFSPPGHLERTHLFLVSH